jgi:hypothetical protein
MRVRIALAAAAALTTLGFAAPAMATPASSTGDVHVQVNILPTVSIWGDNATLNLDGSHSPDNSAAAPSKLHYINNVDANIAASVSGLPVADPGKGIQFHILPNSSDVAAALAAVHSPGGNAYNPVGLLNFNYQNQSASQTLTTSTGVNPSIHDQDIVYVANLPGDLPTPNGYDVVVTYTITANTAP